MDRLKAMAVLAAAVEAGSLSAAGRRLGMPLATVSRTISELEAHLKTRLLNRTTRSLGLTESGMAYVAASRRILEQVGEAERAAAGEYNQPRGELVITAPIVFGRLHVLPVMTHFLQSFPQIDARLMLTDRVAHLMDDHLDVAFRIGALPDSGMVATRLGSVRRVVCASPAYWKAHGVPKAPAALAEHDCISFEALDTPQRWDFPNGAVPVHARLSVNTAEAALDAAMAGLGVTRLLSYQAEQAVEAGRLKIALAAFEPAPMPVHMLHGGQGLLPLKLRTFLDFAAPRLKTRLVRLGEVTREKKSAGRE
jgi:DNA-binding transcriptional LysR family regulator